MRMRNTHSVFLHGSNFSRTYGICSDARLLDFFVLSVLPEAYTLILCIMSIVLGLLSLGLEGLLLWAVQKVNFFLSPYLGFPYHVSCPLRSRVASLSCVSDSQGRLAGIQPWFLSTFILFLMSLIAFVVSGSCYVINPIDHNTKPAPVHNTPSRTRTANTTFPLLNSTFFLRAEEFNGVLGAVQLSTLRHGSNKTEVWPVNRPDVKSIKLNSASKGPALGQHAPVRPTLTLSFLIDVVRALPQLRLVNRFVKTERLHLTHAHSFHSLSALYVKHV